MQEIVQKPYFFLPDSWIITVLIAAQGSTNMASKPPGYWPFVLLMGILRESKSESQTRKMTEKAILSACSTWNGAARISIKWHRKANPFWLWYKPKWRTHIVAVALWAAYPPSPVRHCLSIAWKHRPPTASVPEWPGCPAPSLLHPSHLSKDKVRPESRPFLLFKLNKTSWWIFQFEQGSQWLTTKAL